MALKEEKAAQKPIQTNPAAEENKAKLRGEDIDLSFGAIDRTANKPVEANNTKAAADSMMETSKTLPTTVDKETEGRGAKKVRARENIRQMLGIVSQDEYAQAEKTSSNEIESKIKAAVENGDSFTVAYLNTIKDGYKGQRQKQLDERRVTAGRNLSSLATLAQTFGQIGMASSGGKVPTGKSASEVNSEVTRRLREQYSKQEREDMKATLQVKLQDLQSQILEARFNRKMAAAAALQRQEQEFKAGLAQFDASVKIAEGGANRANRSEIAKEGNQATLGAASIRANSKDDDPKDMIQLAEGLIVHKNQKDAVIAYAKSQMDPDELTKVEALGLDGGRYNNEQMVMKAIQQNPTLLSEIRQKFGSIAGSGGGYGGGRLLGNVAGGGKTDLTGTERKK